MTGQMRLRIWVRGPGFRPSRPPELLKTVPHQPDSGPEWPPPARR